MSTALKSAFASIVSLSVVTGLAVVAAATPSAAVDPPDDATVAVTALFKRLGTKFVPQVASSTALAEQLPTLAVTPAGSVGLRTAFDEAFASGGPLAGMSGATTIEELYDSIDGATGDHWTFSSPDHTATSITVAFTRTVDTDAGLDIRDQDGTISLSTGKGINVRGTLTGSFTFTYDPTTKLASLTNPSMNIATTADLPAGVKLPAGLGILGVEVVGAAGTEDYQLTSTVTTAWANPDNDAAKSLAYDNPATTDVDDDGELAAAGAGTGIVTSTRTGSVSGTLEATPRETTTLITGLPSVGATVTVSSAFPATFDAPAVTAVVPEEAEPFLTLTPRDLAAGLSQAASAIIGMQDAEDTQLPLMRGSIGNAVDAVGGIKAFLAEQVPDSDTNDQTPGQPKFASLQDMLFELNNAAYPKLGWNIDVASGTEAPVFDATTFLASFTIKATRLVTTPLELNPLGAATTGVGTTYSGTGIDASGVDFNGPPTTGLRTDLVGRRVSAGMSYATIANVIDGDSLELTADGWSAGTPTNGTVFSIEAADPKTGAPELADLLASKTGIASANADLSTAMVTPRKVDVTIPMALDLSAPLTYVNAANETVPDCDPDLTKGAPCPFQQVDASGLGRVITSLPLASDRILLRQSVRDVLVADVDISSPVQIDTSSGFLGLNIGGGIKVDTPAGKHLQVLSLEGTGNIPIPAFVEKVRQQAAREPEGAPTKVFKQTLDGTYGADLVVNVSDAPDAFAVGVDSTDITIGGGVTAFALGTAPTVTAKEPARAALLAALNFDAENPLSLFAGVQGALDGIGSDLTTMTGGGLDTPIPLVGSSVAQLIGGGASGGAGVTYTQQEAVPAEEGPPAVEGIPATTTLNDPLGEFDEAFIGRQIVIGSTVSTIVDQTDDTLVLAPQFPDLGPATDTPYLVENELLGAVHALQAMTPSTLQETLAMTQGALGNDSTIDFGLVDAAGGAQLRLDLEWKRSYGVSRPVSIDLGDEQEILGAGAGGDLSIDVSGTVKLRLLLPLSSAAMENPIANTLVDKSESEVGFAVVADADDAYIGANIGPVSVDLGTEEMPGSVHAGFGVTATGATTEAKPSITEFFKGFTVDIDNGDADCELAKEILCADFPVFVSDTQTLDNLTVTTTLGDGDDLAAVFSGTNTKVVAPTDLQALLNGTPFEFGTLSDGLKQYLFYAEVTMRTASNGGEMPVIGKDLQAGADFMGQARRQIDDFIKAEGDISVVSEAEAYLNAQLAKELEEVLGDDAEIKVGFTCSSILEPPADAPGVTTFPVTPPASSTTSYVYQVVSTFKDAKGIEHDSAPSVASDAVTNAATLGGAAYNTVTWVKVPGVTSYRILRATQTTTPPATEPVTGTYVEVGTALGSASSFKDIGATPKAYPPGGVPPKSYRASSGECAEGASVTEIEGVTLEFVMGQGTIDRASGCTDVEDDPAKPCAKADIPVDLGLPGLSLKTGESGSVTGRVGWSLNVKIGMSRASGFYIDTAKQDEFAVGANLQLEQAASDPDLTAQLAIINVDVTKRSDTPEFVGHFGIDIKDSADPGTDLKLSEITKLKVSEAIVVSVNAKVDINWHLQASVDSALPGVGTDFRLTWAWGATTGPPAPPAKPGDAKNLVIQFNNVTLDAGEFFGKALKPYLQQVVDATKPLQPVIDTIFTPMPVISDLSKAAGGKAVTIASLAETFNTLPQGAKIQPFLTAIKTVKQLLAVQCSPEPDKPCGIRIGSFNLLADRVASTRAGAATATSMIDKPPAGGTSETYKPNTAAAADIAKADTSKQLADPAKVSKAAEIKAGLKAGVAIPVMEDPTLIFELITGGDIPLVEFDSGPLALGFQFQKSFGPIYAPPPVMMVIGGGASVTLRIAAGFDTYGIRRAIETGDGAQVLDSLYFKTVDANGKPIPVVQFTGYLEAGASVSIGILEVGVLGGIKLTVGFYWNDPNSDGKFRLFEFSGAVARNPICLFNVGGELSLYIKVFVVIGFSPFSVDFDFTLVNIKLLDFNLKPDCTPPPPKLGGTQDSVLYVFAGKFGGAGPRGDKAWDAEGKKDETWVIRQMPEYLDEQGVKQEAAVEVRGLGITESFPDPGGTTIKFVVLDGRGYTGNLTVSFTGGQAPIKGRDAEPFDKTAVVFTGSGADVIRTGEGSSWVDAGAGADVVTTADRTNLKLAADVVSAHVAGGPGADVITVGNGKDTVSGDGTLPLAPIDPAPAAKRTVKLAGSGETELTDALDVRSLKAPTPAQLHGPTPGVDGVDQIAAGLGQVTLSGNGGNDTIGTANDSVLADSSGIKEGTTGGSAVTEALYRAHSSVLVGGAGSDMLKSGSADDEVHTGSFGAIGQSDPGAGDADTDRNIVDTGTGSDKVYGSNGLDFVTTGSVGSETTKVYGGASSDVLTGGLGTDELYGGPGDDYVVASPATVGELSSATDVLGTDARLVGVLPGAGSSEKLLVGGTGRDRIYGADGPSRIFGDTMNDGCAVQADPVSAQPVERPTDDDASDLIFGGDGVDVVNAGGAGDWVYAAGADDRVCGNAGDDRLYGGDDDDLVQGGSGADQGYGEADDDQVYGNDDADTLYGGVGADRVQGNKGADWLDGGADADVILGGTSKAGSTDGADVLLGAEGADVMVGDNAQTDVFASNPYPTDLAATDATVGGSDYLVGGDDKDSLYGGVGGDHVSGGLEDDYAEGNPGIDRIYGEVGDDDLIGGSSELASGSETGRPDVNDNLYGGAGQDVIAGDNARITRSGVGHPLMTGRVLTARAVDLADEGAGSPAGVSGGDTIESGDGTDVVFGQRGNDVVSLGGEADYGEGGPDADTIHADAGDDDVVGGSYTPASGATGQPDARDLLFGDDGHDVVLGDNGAVTRPGSSGSGTRLTDNRNVPARSITPYDLGDTPTGGTSGADTITGDADNDVLLGQAGNDRVDGGTEADYAEGGQDSDLVLGGDGDDDVAGGSSTTTGSASGSATGQPDGADNVYGGTGSDLAIGDNGLLTRVTSNPDWRTKRADAAEAALVPGRAITLYDLNSSLPLSSTSGHSAGDSLSGQTGVDVLLGQDGDDRISGGGDDDYIEGEGGMDVIHGDVALVLTPTSEIVSAPVSSAWTTPAVDGVAGFAGQDDIAGGSNRAGYRDGIDTINGDGEDDFVVGDNGSIARVLDGTTEREYVERYGAKRIGDAKVRVFPPNVTDVSSTRFCAPVGTLSQASTCEVSQAWGSDRISGDAGEDVLYGQDGGDTINGGTGDDDIYGELGNDTLLGEDGEDAILGDRGGVQNRYETGSRTVTSTLQMPPQVTYKSRLDGSVSREADLLHDTNGTSVGDVKAPAMPLDGITYGGIDTIRGGNGNDSIHAGAGADLVNGDTGGDYVFGDRGNDVMWGGQGDQCTEADLACQANPGLNGEFVDHLMGGKDEDVIDWRPRGVYGPGTTRTCTVGTVPATTKKDGTTDPCSWFEMTGRADDVAGSAPSRADNQHHQGIDWVYGGWDRDVMQGDQSANGPNPGDRLIDWSGVYNLYSHCNAAYGGFNDIRIPSPSMEKFVQEWAIGLGAGRPASTNPSAAADATVPGTSAYDELALVTNSDGKGHGTGSAYPTTPGHFDDAGACSGF